MSQGPAWLNGQFSECASAMRFAEAPIVRSASRKDGLLETCLGSRRSAEVLAGEDAAKRAISDLLGHDAGFHLVREGGAPRVRGPAGKEVAVSITHGKTRAVAVVGLVERIGIDLCELRRAPQVRELAPRFLTRERDLLHSPRLEVACFAAKEAGLKALCLGLLDGGLFDGTCPVEVLSLDPPRIAPAPLQLAFADLPEGVLAVAWSSRS